MNQAELEDLKNRVQYALLAAARFTATERAFVLDCIVTATERSQPTVSVTVFDNPDNYLGRIEAIWAALSIDEGGEGVCAAPFGEMTLPLIAADRKRLDSIIPAAKAIAKMFGKPVRLAKFTRREDVEIYQP